MLKSQLQMLVKGQQNNWADLMDNILFAYSTHHQDSRECNQLCQLDNSGVGAFLNLATPFSSCCFRLRTHCRST